MKELIVLGRWTEKKLDHLLKESSKINDCGARINFLSRQLLNTQYKESTLIGDIKTPEIFIINLEYIDCFTFLDYVEAMRISGSFIEFKDNLRKVRYRSGRVDFVNRNHFFTDWKEFNQNLVTDVTEFVGSGRSRGAKKTLNKRDDKTSFIEGIPYRDREIIYIPCKDIDDVVIEKLKTGDYIGIYSQKQGLDVSHVGIIIKEGNTVSFRHASSSKSHRKVIDEGFKNYIKNKPGIVVLRPMD
jgi:hypothetical protein